MGIQLTAQVGLVLDGVNVGLSGGRVEGGGEEAGTHNLRNRGAENVSGDLAEDRAPTSGEGDREVSQDAAIGLDVDGGLGEHVLTGLHDLHVAALGAAPVTAASDKRRANEQTSR